MRPPGERSWHDDGSALAGDAGAGVKFRSAQRLRPQSITDLPHGEDVLGVRRVVLELSP
jgi:hypothetical protein